MEPAEHTFQNTLSTPPGKVKKKKGGEIPKEAVKMGKLKKVQVINLY